MELSLGNLAGLWALLGVPAVVLIHFFQRETRELPTSTLFLLESLRRESVGGRRFERLRNSLPLWLQLLAVVALTWLLIEPRWVRADSVQRIVLVLDSSVSLTAFQENLRVKLEPSLRRLANAAATTEWIVLETDTRRGTLYSGPDTAAVLGAVDQWLPRLGTHDVFPALQTAQSLVGNQGLAVFVTDQRPDRLPSGVALLAIGEPVDNVGLAGATANATGWHVLVKNHGRTPQTRTWWLETDGDRTAPTELRLAPGEVQTLTGPFPPATDRATVTLAADRFALDDRLPILRPQPKPLTISADAPREFVEKLLRSLDHIERLPDRAASDIPFTTQAVQDVDIRISTSLPGPGSRATTNPPGAAVVFLAPAAAPAQFRTGTIVAEAHELMEDLNWQGLLCRAVPGRTLAETDDVLLWQGDHPLLFLRERQLMVNFSVADSNADRLPAFVLLLHRFVESVREAKLAPEKRNVELNQSLRLTVDPLGGPVTLTPDTRFRGAAAPHPNPLPASGAGGSEEWSRNAGRLSLPVAQAALLRAPDRPGFFTVGQGHATWLEAAAQFADVREADLSAAVSRDDTTGQRPQLLERNSQRDFLAPLWVWLVAALMIGAWVTGRRAA